MEEDILQRKEAVIRWLNGSPPALIAQSLGKTRQWVYKWIKRYKSFPDGDWSRSHSRAPKTVRSQISEEQERQIVRIRNNLLGRKYSQIGALSIQYEFYRLGLKSPPIWTINRVLAKNNLVQKSKFKKSKNLPYPSLYSSCHQMDLVGPRYLKGGYRFYSLNLIDTQSRYAHVHPLQGKSADIIIEGIISFWQDFGFPDSLQMDNELSFRGSNRHPRSLGLILRFILSQGVVPVFIPSGEPWRNGIIERFNDKFNYKFYRVQQFKNFEHIKSEAKIFTKFHNENHRYSTQNNKTPIEMIDLLGRPLKLSKFFKLKKPILLEEGIILFIRFIRSNLKLTILGTEFFMKKELMYSYVVAEIIIDIHTLRVKQDNIVHHVFEFIMPVDC